ncbi:hypothetical protein A8A54_11310 [Brucella pseudogrignonensis]|jgi:hypothetical protein|uniref:hypothetical protein n=1 Tax=Brucella pseudogrignonensis TaxID=419475 RepID=UPI0007DA5E50|nr:hypothetical protein [Brucella pseudogrignonensis]ANG97010.1 hypothetical protein A8A54_11310 [Brucella pseudogrignonensis]MBO1026866.1 hypothetical protein [Ochrobactrum sp. SD129]
MHFNRQLIRSAKIRPFVQSPKLGPAGRSVGLALRELISSKDYKGSNKDLDQLLEEIEVVERKKNLS